MTPSLSLKVTACCIGLAALAAGCQTPEPETGRRLSVRKDACADRLHDICGQLLLYYSTHKRLPPTLEDLESSGALPLPPLVCPVSGKPYVYDPRGARVSFRPGRLVLYDPEPSHSGMRWGILVGTPAGGTSITARVILVAEKDLQTAGP